MSKSIAWVVASLTNVGGGEKLLFEGVEYYRSKGFDVHVFTWAFDRVSLFNDKYTDKDIHVFTKKTTSRANIASHAASRFKSIFSLRTRIKALRPEFVLCQSEYDAVLVWLATLWTGIPFKILIFGQTYQFPHDVAKYSLIFRAHLKKIIPTMPGYVATVSPHAPRLKPLARLVNELICLVRFCAVRAAKTRFTFSNQVAWETKLLYQGAESVNAKGAFRRKIEDYVSDRIETRRRFSVSPTAKVFLALNRLEEKKRTGAIIQGFVDAAIPNSVLLIGGRGPEMAMLQGLIDKLGCGTSVRLLGYVSEEDVWPLKQAADVFVSFDIADFDISPFEALALGTKAIWTNEMDADDGINDLIKRGAITITEPTTAALAKNLREVSETKIEPFRHLMRPYSWESYFERILTS